MSTDAVALVRESAVAADPDQLGEVVIVRDVEFRSVC